MNVGDNTQSWTNIKAGRLPCGIPDKQEEVEPTNKRIHQEESSTDYQESWSLWSHVVIKAPESTHAAVTGGNFRFPGPGPLRVMRLQSLGGPELINFHGSRTILPWRNLA